MGRGHNASRPSPPWGLWRGTRSEFAIRTVEGQNHLALACWRSSKGSPCWHLIRWHSDVAWGPPAWEASLPSSSPLQLTWTISQWGVGGLLCWRTFIFWYTKPRKLIISAWEVYRTSRTQEIQRLKDFNQSFKKTYQYARRFFGPRAFHFRKSA